MKNLNLRTEWVLDKLSSGWMIVDSDGKCLMDVNLADGVLASNLIELALQTMNVNYEHNVIGYDADPTKAEAISQYIFNIREIENDCPNLFAEMEKCRINNMRY